MVTGAVLLFWLRGLCCLAACLHPMVRRWVAGRCQHHPMGRTALLCRRRRLSRKLFPRRWLLCLAVVYQPVHLGAVDKLLLEGWALYDQQRYDASISMAERALRIDRHRSELYQLLSRNYLATLQFQQAEQLARQGLSVSSATDSERSQLQRLLREIIAAQ